MSLLLSRTAAVVAAVTSPGDVSIESDTDASGAGDIILKAGGVERARIKATGTGTGLFSDTVTYLGAASGGDDAATIQAALTAGGRVVGKCGEVYTIAEPLTVDPSTTTFDWRGATISAVGAIDAITITKAGGGGSDNAKHALLPGRLTGDGTAGGQGLRLADYSELFPIFGGSIDGFDVNVQYGNNAWLTKFIGTSIRDAYTANFYVPAGVLNTGEELVLIGCAIFNSIGGRVGKGILAYAGHIRMLGGSIDGIPNRAIEVHSGATFDGACHIEPLAANTDYLLYCADAGSHIRLLPGSHLGAYNGAVATQLIGYSDPASSGIWLSDIEIVGLDGDHYPFTALFNGPGRVRGTTPVASDNGRHTVVGNLAQNLLVDPGFEQAAAKDLTTHSGTANGVNSADDHHSGAQCLKLAPAAGQYIDDNISIACNPGDYVKFNYWVKSALAASVDNVVVKLIYQDANGANTGFQAQTYAVAGSNPDAWTLNGIRLGQAPPGTRKALVHITRASAGALSDGVGAFYLDDCALVIE